MISDRSYNPVSSSLHVLKNLNNVLRFVDCLICQIGIKMVDVAVGCGFGYSSIYILNEGFTFLCVVNGREIYLFGADDRGSNPRGAILI